MDINISVIKTDVSVELRTSRYFNEQEITRLVDSNTISYKEKIKQIAALTRDNANINEALRLLEAYFPSQPVQQEQTPTE